jgi:hypothetical protein
VLLPFNLEVRDDGSTISFLETVEWVWRQSVSCPSFLPIAQLDSIKCPAGASGFGSRVGACPPLPCARRGRARLFSLPSSSHLLTWDRPIISSVVRQPSTSAWSTAQLRTNRKLLVPVLKGKPFTPVIRIQLPLSRFSFFEKMENIQYRTSELLQTQAYP